MSQFPVEPGSRLLWSLRRRTGDVRCILFPDMIPIEVHVLQDRDLVIKEIFLEERAALSWANAYGDRLKQHGWRRSPEDLSPSSAA